MDSVVDTTVLRAANDDTEGAEACRAKASAALLAISEDGRVLLDSLRLILNEYLRNARADGQPGVGDAFLKWLLTNITNDNYCRIVAVTGDTENGLQEFPADVALQNFDDDDRVFVATALAGDASELVVGIDTDYWQYLEPLSAAGVPVRFVCEGEIREVAERKGLG
jgi:hypothetical protein